MYVAAAEHITLNRIIREARACGGTLRSSPQILLQHILDEISDGALSFASRTPCLIYSRYRHALLARSN